MDSEIWVGVVGSGASTTITINHGNATETAADVCEYSGILTSGFLDQSAAASNSSDGTYLKQAQHPPRANLTSFG